MFIFLLFVTEHRDDKLQTIFLIQQPAGKIFLYYKTFRRGYMERVVCPRDVLMCLVLDAG
jgi:hypothetical protein